MPHFSPLVQTPPHPHQESDAVDEMVPELSPRFRRDMAAWESSHPTDLSTQAPSPTRSHRHATAPGRNRVPPSTSAARAGGKGMLPPRNATAQRLTAHIGRVLTCLLLPLCCTASRRNVPMEQPRVPKTRGVGTCAREDGGADCPGRKSEAYQPRSCDSTRAAGRRGQG